MLIELLGFAVGLLLAGGIFGAACRHAAKRALRDARDI